MKFARYLEQTAIPEWKKKYINYKGCKKHISAIRKDREEKRSQKTFKSSRSLASADRSSLPTNSPESHRRPRASSVAGTTSILQQTPATPQYGSTGKTPPVGTRAARSPSVRLMLPPAHESAEEFSLPPPAKAIISDGHEVVDGAVPMSPSAHTTSFSPRPRIFRKMSLRRTRSHLNLDRIRPSYDSYSAMLEGIEPLERNFFDFLDAEIEKAECFYNDRYQEAAVRFTALKEQVRELVEHKRAHQASKEATKGSGWVALPYVTSKPTHVIEAAYKGLTKRVATGKNTAEDVVEQVASEAQRHVPFHRDPETYHSAKKDLKHAILEFHRFLELLRDFQALNMTAIRKSIKKFEKTTTLNIHDMYNKERVSVLSLASEDGIKGMIDELERIYAARFEAGDLKKARNRLRNPQSFRTHHFSVFRSGMMIGAAIPAVVVGFYQAFQPDTQARMPNCWPLMEVYATLAIPVIFSLLVGLNILAWSRKRLNYAFIFELDLRSTITPWEYFEIPSFLILTLSYAFMISFSGFFSSSVAPTTWPLIWLIIFATVLFNPIRIIHSPSRFWLLRNWTWLCLPGLQPVEFADFWMGDQLCSMVYTLSHFYFMGCVYSTHWDSPLTKCNLANNWIAGIVLTSIPSFIRFIQCLKRYADSKNYIHLINGGKYCSSIVAYGVFFNWRSRGMPGHGHHYAVWIFLSAVSSLYTSGWDLLMDWSLLQRHVPHKLLRKEVVYTDFPGVGSGIYYIAMVTNVLVRFVWVIYIDPSHGLDYRTRNATAAFLEMLRRVQWNFFRVENEHLGNADQYRVTREVPLPYTFDNGEAPDDSDEDEDDKQQPPSRIPERMMPSSLVQPSSQESFTEPADKLRNVRLSAIESNDALAEA